MLVAAAVISQVVECFLASAHHQFTTSSWVFTTYAAWPDVRLYPVGFLHHHDTGWRVTHSACFAICLAVPQLKPFAVYWESPAHRYGATQRSSAHGMLDLLEIRPVPLQLWPQQHVVPSTSWALFTHQVTSSQPSKYVVVSSKVVKHSEVSKR